MNKTHYLKKILLISTIPMIVTIPLVTISCNENHRPVKWEVRELIKEYLKPLEDKIDSILKILEKD